MKKHAKHSKLTRRKNGHYAPLEISILGSNCTLISKFVEELSLQLNNKYKLAYLDASHNETLQKPNVDLFTFSSQGLLEAKCARSLNNYNEKIKLAQYDLSFINGNHYKGEKQIVILDAAKEKSIIKRLDQITDVLFFIIKDESSFMFDCLKKKIKNIEQIPVFKLNEIQNITKNIQNYIQNNIPVLNGLVLAGGKSKRMGTDKAKLKYYAKEHSLYLMDLLHSKKIEVYLSTNSDKQTNYPIIKDSFTDLGPLGAICSAFMKFPNNAFLVLATDLPYINSKLLEGLISERDSSKIATAVKGKTKDFPEPLITIWEPKAYPVLLSYLSQGYSCPRKVLINSDIKILEVDDDVITNVNTKEEFEKVKISLK